VRLKRLDSRLRENDKKERFLTFTMKMGPYANTGRRAGDSACQVGTASCAP
jgi:hypothetical protein